uniref:Putative secreted protein n=1 Tax=Anopheles triannulatus TaxID=58253 RepID=A0A2M4B6T1_9DIPT
MKCCAVCIQLFLYVTYTTCYRYYDSVPSQPGYPKKNFLSAATDASESDPCTAFRVSVMPNLLRMQSGWE